MQFSTIFISAITVIASVHGASIPAMDPSASSQVALEARSYNDQGSTNNLKKRSPGYGGMGGNFNNQMNDWGGFNQMQFVHQPQMSNWGSGGSAWY
ncbi:hypothetical protein BASA50_006067 [Batrachochytrium salamandrivorans]|uniref:Uncharacterized protein n=1 Tax=Batrachochytrium salamandrivorans TaxID=1357716 RepID=A0ABQ8FEI9_9FUNG|nr:hypothetical protein BASA60_002331 [Batrachochytrium salamandrivorans]KAH6595273.1 hypothetical protein BASA50_006067 [Batrachochytrium salamandrivorans]KAH9245019.1 hypothetical protein BASA81_017530 [Batrachochytrium salamandrivorans]